MTVMHNPLIVGLPLDHEVEDVLAASLELGKRLKSPIVIAHALGERFLESERGLADRIQKTKKKLVPHLEQLCEAGLAAHEEIEVKEPADFVLETAQRNNGELIVIGGGRQATVVRWMVGSVAETIVRRATIPVWVARGVLPVGQPVLCPVDLSPQSKLGLTSAIHMARLLQSPLKVMTVISESQSSDDAYHDIEVLLNDFNVDDIQVEIVVERGEPAECIVEASQDAGLLVVCSKGFDPLVPEWLGPITTRAIRSSRCNILAIREVDANLDRRVSALLTVAKAYRNGWKLVQDDRADEALPLLEYAAEHAPFNAAIQGAYAIVLKKVGREVEARGRREIAELIRTRIDISE